MINQVEYHYLAEQELNDAMDFYEEKKDGLGYSFVKTVQNKVDLITSYPERYPKRKGHYRVTTLRTFPYNIVYRFNKSKGLITISSIYHTRRNPKNKFRK